MYYRLFATFEPHHPKLTGSRSTNSKRGQRETVRRGAWRVCHSVPAGIVKDIPIVFAVASERVLFSSSVRQLCRGRLCNPHKLLNEVIAAERRKRGRE